MGRWKDMKEPMSLEEYAESQVQDNFDQPMDLSALAEPPWETIYANFDPNRPLRDDIRGRTSVYTQPAINALRAGAGEIPVKSYETGGFLVPRADGGYGMMPPVESRPFERVGRHGITESDHVELTPPPGREFGAHRHIPGRGGFADQINRVTPYGDSGSLAGPNPYPMATIVRRTQGPDRGQDLFGVHEIFNGQLRFRAPYGTLTDQDRDAIQKNRDEAQSKLYKNR